ncbi:MAG: metal ABC transporter permease [Myxococcales bacterium]|nr:metal ABC transporter permease [Myxococcales bacterium]
MADGAPASSSEALSQDELEEAFGGDLGAGPGAEPSATAAAAPGPAPPVLGAERSAREGTPSFGEFVHGWELGIYRDPVLCGVFAGLVLGVLGVFVVLRRAVFVTAAVSQAAGLGVALAFLVELSWHIPVPPVAGAVLLALAATGVLSLRMQRTRLPSETLVGLIYLGASAGAILVGDRIAQESHDIASILFGTAVLVRPLDLSLVIGVGLVTLALLAVCHRGFLFAGFDPEGARVHRLPVRALDLLLWTLVAVEVSVTTRAIGALPVFAFAVVPAMAALALVERVRWALAVAAVFGALSGGLGYLFAFFFEFPVGASQATLALLFLLVCLPIARLLRGAAA